MVYHQDVNCFLDLIFWSEKCYIRLHSLPWHIVKGCPVRIWAFVAPIRTSISNTMQPQSLLVTIITARKNKRLWRTPEEFRNGQSTAKYRLIVLVNICSFEAIIIEWTYWHSPDRSKIRTIRAHWINTKFQIGFRIVVGIWWWQWACKWGCPMDTRSLWWTWTKIPRNIEFIISYWVTKVFQMHPYLHFPQFWANRRNVSAIYRPLQT